MPDARDDVAGAPRRQPGGYRRVVGLRRPRARTRSASRCGGMLPNRNALVVSPQERRQLVECLTPSALAVAGQVAAVEDDELIRHEQLGLAAAR